jgi:hypothetical protein
MRMIGWTAALLAASLATVLTQTPAQAQNANIYDGKDHQPDAAVVQQQEQAAGVATPQQQQSLTNEIEQLNRQVLQNAQTPTGAAAGCSPSQQVCP